MSPVKDIEADLKEAQKVYRSFNGGKVSRTFLTGANPFVLKYEKLMDIAEMIHRYFRDMETIGSFARVTDVALKTDEQLAALRGAGYDGLTIGIETADDKALRFMDKGYLAADILEQCRRLDKAGIGYSFFYLTGISGAGRGNWKEESETEKYREVRVLAERLEIPTEFAAMGASNAFQFHCLLPKDKKRLLTFLDDVIKNAGEDKLRRYRESVHHL